MLTQRRWIRDRQGCTREIAWSLDLAAASSVQAWAVGQRRLAREAEAMAEMYPAWTLTLARGNALLARKDCEDICVPANGAWRWASDGGALQQTTGCSLAWEGLLPAPLSGLPKAAERLRGRFSVQEIDGHPWTTVPVYAIYPDRFPYEEMHLYYEAAWLKSLKVDASPAQHIFGDRRLCLFFPGQWKRGYTVADVLSLRVVNHVYSILKIANGRRPHDAFIGRIHDDRWIPGERPRVERSYDHDDCR